MTPSCGSDFIQHYRIGVLEHGRRKKTNSADLAKAYTLLIGMQFPSIEALKTKMSLSMESKKYKVVQGCEIKP